MKIPVASIMGLGMHNGTKSLWDCMNFSLKFSIFNFLRSGF
jgi:hypothetical protein